MKQVLSVAPVLKDGILRVLVSFMDHRADHGVEHLAWIPAALLAVLEPAPARIPELSQVRCTFGSADHRSHLD